MQDRGLAAYVAELVGTLFLTFAICTVVVLYVAFPHRGEDVPHVPWLGRLLRKGVDNVPTLDNTSDAPEPEPDSSLTHDLTSLGQSRPEGGRRRA